ncbi:acetyl esterase/lipase [Paenibacillus phyllosphaerae]|uniref:Acetyl esterase/lipase n=1 Tax=Paenibacillus phyllosphaerae TaxID=274593 RepID=A0A7W5AWR9_9BACL|nr:alpha/beta hydrolase [Paenibacillus phyllosphaerae]MBB3110107.1 acetyl esterase/lipase [Paenibacillus phyllosphaerae]
MAEQLTYSELLARLQVRQVEEAQHERMTFVRKAIPDLDGAGILDPRVREQKQKELEAAASRPSGPPVDSTAIPIEDLRAMMGWPNHDLSGGTIRTALAEIEGSNGTIQVRIYTPVGDRVRPAVLFFHGGGFIGGSVDTVENPCKSLAQKADAVVINVDYRLAPEHPWPAGLTDCYDTVRWAFDHADELGVDRTRITVAGDSAGGNLAACCSIMDRDAGNGYIRYQALIYPVVVIAQPEQFHWQPEEYAIGADEALIHFSLDGLRNAGSMLNALYLQGAGSDNPLVSPLLIEDAAGLPELLVVTAEYDYLRLEGEAYGQLLAEAGVRTRVIRYEGMDHAFLDKYGEYPQAEDCMDELARGIWGLPADE